MKPVIRVIAVAATVLVVMPCGAGAQSGGDREAVRQAALDYVEGIYQVQPDRIRRSVHPSLVKRGFFKKAADGPYTESPMTFDQLVQLAASWNKDGKRDTSIKQVDIYEVLDQTASAKVTASWGSDYLLLAKHDGQWKIHLILWQGPPPKTTMK
jgi:hypothetical protein